MAIQNGTLIRTWVGGTFIGHSISDNFSATMATRDTTTKDSSGWTEKLGALKSWTADAKGYFDTAEPEESFSELWALYIARAPISVEISSDEIGEKKYAGSALITELSRGAELEGNVTYSIKFEGTGALTESTIS